MSAIYSIVFGALCFMAGLLIGWKANQQYLYGKSVDALAAMMRADAAKKAAQQKRSRR